MLLRQVAYKYHGWTRVRAHWSADKNVKSKRSTNHLVHPQSTAKKNRCSSICCSSRRSRSLSNRSGGDGRCYCGLCKIHNRCPLKRNNNQTGPPGAGFHSSQADQPGWLQTSHWGYYSVMAAQWRTDCSDHWQELNFQILMINPSNVHSHRWAKPVQTEPTLRGRAVTKSGKTIRSHPREGWNVGLTEYSLGQGHKKSQHKCIWQARRHFCEDSRILEGRIGKRFRLVCRWA